MQIKEKGRHGNKANCQPKQGLRIYLGTWLALFSQHVVNCCIIITYLLKLCSCSPATRPHHSVKCENIASRTNGAGCIYIRNTYIPYMYIYIYIYIKRQIFILSTSVELTALTPINCIFTFLRFPEKDQTGSIKHEINLVWPDYER